MIERKLSVEDIEIRMISSGIVGDQSLFVWIGDKQQLFSSLHISYPAISFGPTSTTIFERNGETFSSDNYDGYGEQLAKKITAKTKRPVLMSFHLPSDTGTGLELGQRLQLAEKALMIEILSM